MPSASTFSPAPSTLLPPLSCSVPADNVTMVSVASTADGRIFMGGAGAQQCCLCAGIDVDRRQLAGAAGASPAWGQARISPSTLASLSTLSFTAVLCRRPPVRAAVLSLRQLALQALPKGGHALLASLATAWRVLPALAAKLAVLLLCRCRCREPDRLPSTSPAAPPCLQICHTGGLRQLLPSFLPSFLFGSPSGVLACSSTCVF